MSGYLDYEDESYKAFEYLESSTDSEIRDVAAKAYFDLAYMYYVGVLGPQTDTAKAISYFGKAMEEDPGLTGICNDYIARVKMYDDDSVSSEIYYKKALDYYKTSAEMGNINSICYTAYYYQYGFGTEINTEKAMDYFRKAANRNIPDAFCNIGYLYESGEGNVKQDFDKAYEWFEKAVDMDYAEGMKAIGDMYYRGEYGQKADGTEDYNTARLWYEKAIESGYLGAYNSLAAMYEYGFGADEDYDKAYSLYYKNAEFGNSTAMFEIGNMYNRGYLNEDPDNDADAVTWYLKAAEHENTDAMNAMGLLYEEYEQYDYAAEWYLAAASRNDIKGMNNLAWLYYMGSMTGEPDYENALKWFKRAADAGDRVSEMLVANMTMDGIGTDSGSEAAKELYEKIIEEGNADSSVYYALGIIYLEDKEVPKDLSKALGYLEKAAEMDNDQACEKLGDLYFEGVEVNYDISAAAYYYKRAEDCGNASGHVYKQLGDMYHTGNGVIFNDATAKTYYLLAEDQGLKDAEMFANLGNFYYLDGLYTKSIEYFEKSIDIYPDPEYMYNVGCAYYTMNDYQNALLWFGKALDNGFERSFYLKQDIENMVSAGLISEEDAAPYIN